MKERNQSRYGIVSLILSSAASTKQSGLQEKTMGSTLKQAVPPPVAAADAYSVGVQYGTEEFKQYESV